MTIFNIIFISFSICFDIFIIIKVLRYEKSLTMLTDDKFSDLETFEKIITPISNAIIENREEINKIKSNIR